MLGSVRSFAKCSRGNVAMLFGLSIIPVIGLAGAAMDYASAARDRSILQSALDAGALAGARALPTMTQTQARSLAESYARANLPTRMRTMPLTTEITNGGQSVRVAGTTTSNTGLLNVLGVRTLPVTADSEARAASMRRIEVALALDNTGSMGSAGKIQALRTATLEFLDILENSGRPVGDVLVGIVPFATGVRLPLTYRNASFLYRVNGADWSTNRPQWDGCIWDRDVPFNTQNVVPVGSLGRFPRASCAGIGQSELQELRPLTSDFSALRSTVNAMNPAGMTNVTIGAAWGWHVMGWSISPSGVSLRTPPANTDRFLVLLTDGDNTQDRFGSNSGSAIDTRTRSVCANMRLLDPTLRVITVRVIDGNATLLRDCATTPSDYYNVANSSELVGVFQRIAWQISSLRLTQ